MTRENRRRALQRISVTGRSMEPALFEGDWLIFRHPLGPLMGKIVLVARLTDPGQLTIKRVVRQQGARYWVEGDNKDHSTDSRKYGFIEASEIVGSYLVRYKKVSGRKPC